MYNIVQCNMSELCFNALYKYAHITIFNTFDEH